MRILNPDTLEEVAKPSKTQAFLNLAKHKFEYEIMQIYLKSLENKQRGIGESIKELELMSYHTPLSKKQTNDLNASSEKNTNLSLKKTATLQKIDTLIIAIRNDQDVLNDY